jgi:hypothetical protein
MHTTVFAQHCSLANNNLWFNAQRLLHSVPSDVYLSTHMKNVREVNLCIQSLLLIYFRYSYLMMALLKKPKHVAHFRP